MILHTNVVSNNVYLYLEEGMGIEPIYLRSNLIEIRFAGGRVTIPPPLRGII